jgi:hypothetical protein
MLTTYLDLVFGWMGGIKPGLRHFLWVVLYEVVISQKRNFVRQKLNFKVKSLCLSIFSFNQMKEILGFRENKVMFSILDTMPGAST